MRHLAGNNSHVWRYLACGYPMGWMLSPASGFKRPVRCGIHMPFAIDNGMYYPHGGTPKGQADLEAFYRFIERCSSYNPLFVAVPDAPYDGAKTRRMYQEHESLVRRAMPGVRVAMCVQDGMDESDLDAITPPGAVFVGGSTAWKWSTMPRWVEAAQRRGFHAHVARVNTISRVRQCVDAGADTSDGTGIWRGDRKQLAGVLEALSERHLFLGREHVA